MPGSYAILLGEGKGRSTVVGKGPVQIVSSGNSVEISSELTSRSEVVAGKQESSLGSKAVTSTFPAPVPTIIASIQTC